MRSTLQLFALAALVVGSPLVGACTHKSPLAPEDPARSATHALSSSIDLVDPRVVITVNPGVDPYAIAATYGATIVRWEPEERLVTMVPPARYTPATFTLAIAGDPRIATCEEDAELEGTEARQQSFSFDDGLGSDASYLEQPSASSIGVNEAHAVSIGSGVRVAVLDTGVDPNHTALAMHLEPGYDFVDGDSNPIDLPNGLDDDDDTHIDESYGHGTHVAGIIALVAPGARILPVRVLDADGRGTVMAVASGLRWAVAHGAKVINLSLGTLGSSDAIQDVLDEAENSGVIVLCSAGNWGDSQHQEYPARSSHACAVGAVDASRQPAPFSSYGSFVDLSAPGVGVRSPFPGNRYRVWSGTSMSAPFVSGVAALLVSLHPTWGMLELCDRMAATAMPFVGGTPEQQQGLGAGVINAAAALAPDASLAPAPTGSDETPAPMARPRR